MVWKEIKGYEGRYMVSDTGKIMSLPRTIKTSRGYRTISKKRILKCSKLRNGTKVIRLVDKESSPNLCVNYFFSRALVVQGMPLHPCLCTSTLEGAVKGAPLRTSKRFP